MRHQPEPLAALLFAALAISLVMAFDARAQTPPLPPAPVASPAGATGTAPTPAATAATPIAAPAPAAPPTPPPEPFGLTPERLVVLQAALRTAGLDGWLFADFRRSDPIAYRVLNLDLSGARSRRWYCLIPAQGAPRKLVHAIEPRALDGVPGSAAVYASWRERDKELARLLQGARRVAMDWSPRNEIPTVSRVDGGTLELVRSLGVEPVSAADLIALAASTLSAAELADQARTTELLGKSLDAVAEEAARRIRAGTPATEKELQEFAQARWKADGLLGEGWPGVSADAHTADPHYAPAAQGSAAVVAGSFLLLDFATRAASGPHSIFADLTKVYYIGERVPSEVAKAASAVFGARDAALALLKARLENGAAVTGAEVDTEARRVLIAAGYGDRILHRTGHSIDTHGHGDGVNNDDFETHDARRHLVNTCFSIEPGVYLAGRFGVRSEIDACILPGAPGGPKARLEVRGGGPLQQAVQVLR